MKQVQLDDSDFTKAAMIIWDNSDKAMKEHLMKAKYFQKESIELNIRKRFLELDKTARTLITKIILHKISQ